VKGSRLLREFGGGHRAVNYPPWLGNYSPARPLRLDRNPCSSASDFEGFRCALKVVNGFEPSDCEHRALLRNAHDLCRLGYGA
jgi:hypothetical protein